MNKLLLFENRTKPSGLKWQAADCRYLSIPSVAHDVPCTFESRVNLSNPDFLAGLFDGTVLPANLDAYIDGSGQPYAFFLATDTGEHKLQSNIAIQSNKDTMVSFVFDVGNAYVYVNGVLGGSAPYTSVQNGFTIVGNVGGYYPLLNGIIKEIRIWNTARSQTQIQKTMGKQLNGNEAGLVGYYPLTELNGQIAHDKTIKANHGTIYGASSLFASPWNVAPRPVLVLLSIPTPDSLPNVAHPSMVYVPGGWNGYQYWMAFTPYPADPRENPCILASNDLIDWVIPTGLTNPVVPISEATADGYQYNSDPELILLSNNQLCLTWRMSNDTTGAEGIYIKTSSDGVTWSATQQVISSSGSGLNTDNLILSPARVIESNGSHTMWSINYSTHNIERRTSADGIAWSAPSNCAFSIAPYLGTGFTISALWHIEVRKGQNYYHILVCENGPYRLYYMISSDGINWTGDQIAYIPSSGQQRDIGGYYRSTFLVKSENPTILQVLATEIGTIDDLDDWRLYMLQ
jgi:hypothetical protein